jgi:hypothetical protein
MAPGERGRARRNAVRLQEGLAPLLTGPGRQRPLSGLCPPTPYTRIMTPTAEFRFTTRHVDGCIAGGQEGA